MYRPWSLEDLPSQQDKGTRRAPQILPAQDLLENFCAKLDLPPIAPNADSTSRGQRQLARAMPDPRTAVRMMSSPLSDRRHRPGRRMCHPRLAAWPSMVRSDDGRNTFPMAISANLDKVLDKAYESSSLADLVDAPVSALAGVSEADAEALKKAFNIKTIGDLASNKYVRAATAIVEIASIAK
jgi:hypothetical protein